MSYILDALRRADAERERDPARGIHAQPLAAAPAPAGGQVPRWAWGAILAAGAVVAGYVAWPEDPPPPPAPVPVVRGIVQQPAAAPVPAAVTVADSVSPPAPPPQPVRVAREAPATVLKAPGPAAVPEAGPAPATVAGKPAAPAPDRILAVAELPPDVQRDLPKLAISGGVHSENAAQRMLIVGGQVMNEGAELAPGVVLEQIRARNAVLRFRGFRYSVPF